MVHSDVPGRFQQGMRLWALADDGSRRELKVEALWPHKGHLVFQFAGCDSISEAEALVGCELQVPSRERARLEPGWTYVSDLLGCLVFDGGREIGRVEDVQFGAGEAPLLIVKAGSQEYEIPYAEAFLKSADLAGKRIQMSLPEGMLEVNAPLTAEEKRQQRNSRKLSS
jgi:16S rRNA processing protein RimM